jgi:glycosyltransferase involved in cell wall biosynthesis
MSIPNKVAEYLSQGLPIISSLIAGPSGKLIREQDAGWTYPYGDSDALAAAIEAAVTRWAARGRVPDPRLQKYQREELNADVSTAQLEALLTGLAASRA